MAFFKNFKNLQLSFGLTNFFEDKIFLSDMDTAIKKLIRTLHSTQYICYRHLIESFGSNTLLSIVINCLLFTSSEQELELELPQALSDLNHLLHIDGRNDEIQQYQIAKIVEYFPIQFSDDKFERDFTKSLTFDQSLWKRSVNHVSSCSNHIERLHRTLKAKTAKILSIQMRVAIVVNELCSKFDTPMKNPGIQAMKLHSKMKANAIT
jgi:hypothetical protein